MANTIYNATKVATQALVEFENAFVLKDMVTREYEKEFGPTESGDVVNIRRPPDFTPVQGRVQTPQDIVDANAKLRVDQQWGIAYEMTSFEFTMKDEEMAERFSRPIARQLASVVETYIADLGKKVPSWLGTPGALVDSYAKFLAPVTYLTEVLAPRDGRMAMMTPGDYSALAAAETALFSNNAVDPALRERDVKRLANTNVMESTMVSRFRTGNFGGTPLINGGTQNVTYAAATAGDLWQQTLAVDGWTASVANVVRAGDTFTIAGVNRVNPVTKRDTGKLQQFVVLADASSNGSGQTTLTISPPIISSGSQQTVSAAPADNAPLTFKGASNTDYDMNLMWHKNAIALVMPPLRKPKAAVFSETASHKGLSMRVTGGFDVTNDKDMIRFDILFGADVINPKLATRFSG